MTSLKKCFFIIKMVLPCLIYLYILERIKSFVWAGAEADGALHIFHIVTSSWWGNVGFLLTILIFFFTQALILSSIFARNKWFIGMTIVGLFYLIINVWVYSMCFGFVEMTGIRYSNVDTHFRSQKMEWNEIAKQANLKITVISMKGGPSFGGALMLQTNNGQLLPFDIMFDLRDEKEYQSLTKVLILLKENNIQVITSVKNTTSGDKQKDEAIDKIRALTEGKNIKTSEY